MSHLCRCPRILFALALAALAVPAARSDSTLPADAAARLGSLRFRTGGEVKMVAFAPDGRTLAAASDDGMISLFDADTGKERSRLAGHDQGVRSVAFSPDGTLLASASYDLTIRLWETATGKSRHVLRCPRGVALALSFSPDGKTLASAHRNRALVLIDTATGQEIRASSGHSNWVTAVAFSPDGQAVASASRDRSIAVWKAQTGDEIRRIETPQGVHAALFSADGTGIFAAGADGVIREWDAASGKERRTFTGHEGSVYGLARVGDTLASCGSDGTIRLWDTATGKESRKIAASAEPLFSFAISADGKRIAAAASGRHLVRLWQTADGKEVAPPLPSHEAGITALAFSPDGAKLVAAGVDRRLSLWSPALARLVHIGPGHERPIYSLAFAGDGRSFTSIAEDRTIRLWNASTGKEERRFDPDGALALVGLTFAADGTPQAWTTGVLGEAIRARLVMFSGQQNYNLYLTDLASNKPIRTFEANLARFQADPNGLANLMRLGAGAWPGHVGPIASVSVSGDRSLLASGSHDSTIGIWRMTTGKLLGKVSGHTGRVSYVAFTGDDRTLVSSADDGTVRLWEIATRSEVLASVAPAYDARALTLAPDGRTLAWASASDVKINLWDLTAGKTGRVLPGHAKPATVLAFAPDGSRLASGSADTTILLWDLAKPDQPADKSEFTADELDTLWTALASDRAAIAYPAMWKLRAAPDAALAFFKKRLVPTDPGSFKTVAHLIKELDHQEFDVRSQAQATLEKYGDLAERELTLALEKRPPLEVVRRIQELVFALEQKRSTGLAPAEELRAIRSIQVLEWIASADARDLLKSLAAGSPMVRQTQEAKGSLARLEGGR